MNKLIVVIFSIFSFGLSAQEASRAQVDIQWDKPEKYRDVRPTNESRKRFRERVFVRIDEYINQLAIPLPAEAKLIIKVTDLDLAGQVFPASYTGLNHSASDIRVIKDIYIPRISFCYRLLNKTGDTLQAAEVKLKDMTFLNSTRFSRNEPLRYEKVMLERWFNKEFSGQFVHVTENNQAKSES